MTIGPVVATPTRGQTDAEIARDRKECEAEATEGRESGFRTFVKTKVGWTIAGALLGLTVGVAVVAGGPERSLVPPVPAKARIRHRWVMSVALEVTVTELAPVLDEVLAGVEGDA